MKKILSIIAIITSMSSCNLLEIEPVSQITSDQAFSNLNSAEGVINGMYNNLQTPYMWRVQVISDVASDMSQQIDTWDALIAADEFNFSIDNTEVEDLYTSFYRCIDIANSIIANVPAMDISQEIKDDMLGQAYFVRGLSYFDLARFFGGYPNVYGELGVVITLTPSVGISPDDLVPRNSLRETYDQVEADLQQALSLLPESRASATLTKAKVTKPAARALLARYYLYNQQWAQAEEFASAAIAERGLTVPFETIFRSKNTDESFFEVQFSNVDIMGLRNWYFPSTLSARGGAALHTAMHQDIIADANDVRANLIAQNPITSTYYTTKWATAQNSDNFQLLRLAEQYLIRAEARAEQSNLDGALADLNVVRARAGISALTGLDQAGVLDAILNERKLEFVGEGHRWFDVIRRGLGLTVFSNVVRTNGSQPSYAIGQEGRQILPIPAVEMRANTALQQNEAYR